MDDPQRPSGTARALLLVVAAIVVIESAVYLVLAALDLRDTPSERLGSGIGIAVLLAAYGLGQLAAARLLLRGRSGARAPLIVTQLLQVLIATNLRGEPRLALAVAVPAIAVLVMLLSSPVSAALRDHTV